MGKMSCVVVLFICFINLGLAFGFGGVSGEKACNGTLGDCFSYGGDMEFLGGEEAGDLLRHYAAGARWLLGAAGKFPLPLQPRPFCKTGQYANCVQPGKSKTRPCPAYTRCKRADSGSN